MATLQNNKFKIVVQEKATPFSTMLFFFPYKTKQESKTCIFKPDIKKSQTSFFNKCSYFLNYLDDRVDTTKVEKRVYRVDISGLEENWMTGVVEMGWDSIPDVRKEE